MADPANPAGYVDVDKHTLQHARYPNVFALGDAGSTPNPKTGAAVRKAPLVAQNLIAAMADKPLPQRYDGYASCPPTTSRNTVLLTEFDYTLQPRPSFPIIDSTADLTLGERLQMGAEKVIDILREIWPSLLTGIGVGALIHVWAPADFFTTYAGPGNAFGSWSPS